MNHDQQCIDPRCAMHGSDPDQVLEKVDALVREHGWAVINVLESDAHPEFDYTVGLSYSYGHPELIMVGFGDAAEAKSILNMLGARIRDEGVRYESGQLYDRIFANDYKALMLEAAPDTAERCIKVAYAHARKHFREPPRLLQLVMPDANRRFFYDPAYDPAMDTLQPILGSPEAIARAMVDGSMLQ